MVNFFTSDVSKTLNDTGVEGKKATIGVTFNIINIH